MKNKNLQKITVSAVLIGLATVLSLVKVVQMPLGGSVTVVSMLPICLISIMYGPVFAIMPCVLYGVIQMVIDGVFGWGLTPATLIGSIVFDYLLAFGILCLAGLFRKKGIKGIIGGVAVALLGRFLSSFISGCIFFQCFDIFNNPYIWSLCYNGAYMLPEIITTAICAALLFKSETVKKLIV